MFLNNAFPEQAVLLCRGPGEDDDLPPVMNHVNGVPFLGHVLGALKRNEVLDIILVCGECGVDIEDAYRDGTQYGMRFRYLHDPEDELGSGGALLALDNKLGPAFFVVQAERFLQLDYESLGAAFVQEGLPYLMSVWEDLGAERPGAVKLDKDAMGRSIVTRYDPEARGRVEHIEYGAAVFRDDVVDILPPGYSELSGFFQRSALKRRIGAFKVSHRYYDVSTPSGLRDLREGIVSGAVPSYIHLLG